MDDINSNLCRICLQSGATYSIFEKSETERNVYDKLATCLQCEKIEDINGYPRHICSQCNTTLETLYSFINKYRESSKILEDGMKIIKKETKYEDESDYILSDVEIEVKGIKLENDHFDDNFDDLEDEKPLNILKKIKKEPIKIESKHRRSKAEKGSRTSRSNKIASSILEGNLGWL